MSPIDTSDLFSVFITSCICVMCLRFLRIVACIPSLSRLIARSHSTEYTHMGFTWLSPVQRYLSRFQVFFWQLYYSYLELLHSLIISVCSAIQDTTKLFSKAAVPLTIAPEVFGVTVTLQPDQHLSWLLLLCKIPIALWYHILHFPSN